MLFSDLAIIPDVFHLTSYDSPKVHDLCISSIEKLILTGSVIRDLHSGKWREFINSRLGISSLRAQKFIKQILAERAYVADAISKGTLVEPAHWCVEALESHKADALSGIIASEPVASKHRSNPIVGSVEKLSEIPWWLAFEKGDETIPRNTSEYLRCFKQIFDHANSLMFIDRFLDPESGEHREFPKLLDYCANRKQSPGTRIEIHRVVLRGTRRENVGRDVWEADFNRWLKPYASKLRIEVFFWDDFHARFLNSNLVGVHVDQGFTISGDRRSTNYLQRVPREKSMEIDKEFNPDFKWHDFKYKFSIYP